MSFFKSGCGISIETLDCDHNYLSKLCEDYCINYKSSRSNRDGVIGGSVGFGVVLLYVYCCLHSFIDSTICRDPIETILLTDLASKEQIIRIKNLLSHLNDVLHELFDGVANIDLGNAIQKAIKLRERLHEEYQSLENEEREARLINSHPENEHKIEILQDDEMKSEHKKTNKIPKVTQLFKWSPRLYAEQQPLLNSQESLNLDADKATDKKYVEFQSLI